jgi:hypothetical protein
MRGRIFEKDGLNLETKVYRTFSVERLFQLFETNENVVVRPALWDDTFENLALSSKVSNGAETGSFEFKDDIYGQCWTLQTASDAIWRIYSQGTNGIRIRSTVGKLLESLANSSQLGANGDTFVGKVNYLGKSKLLKLADTHFTNGNVNPESIAKTLTFKRKAFLHEKEVRLIYVSDNRQADPVLKFGIDPHNFVDQIMLHPQLSVAEADRLKWMLKNYLNYQGEVKRSLLYAPPRGFIFKL